MYPRVSKLVSTTRICAMVIVKTFLPEDVENIAEAVASAAARDSVPG